MKFIFWVYCAILIFLAAFRGGDSDLDGMVYLEFFREIEKYKISNILSIISENWGYYRYNESSLFVFEAGFVLYTFLISLVHESGFVYFLITATISLVIKFYVIYIRCERPIISVLWYSVFCFPFLEFSAIRAGLACAFIFLAFNYKLDGKLIKSYLMIMIGASFHVSVIIFIPVLLFLNNNIFRKRYLIFYIIFSLLMIFFGEKIFDLSSDLFHKIKDYKNSLNVGGEYSNINIFNSITVFFIFYFFVGKYFVKHEVNNVYEIFYLYPLVVFFGFFYFPIMAFRLLEITAALQVFYVGLVGRKFILRLIFLIFGLFFVVKTQIYMESVNLFYFIYDGEEGFLRNMSEKSIFIYHNLYN